VGVYDPSTFMKVESSLAADFAAKGNRFQKKEPGGRRGGLTFRPNKARSHGAILKLIFQDRYALQKVTFHGYGVPSK